MGGGSGTTPSWRCAAVGDPNGNVVGWSQRVGLRQLRVWLARLSYPDLASCPSSRGLSNSFPNLPDPRGTLCTRRSGLFTYRGQGTNGGSLRVNHHHLCLRMQDSATRLTIGQVESLRWSCTRSNRSRRCQIWVAIVYAAMMRSISPFLLSGGFSAVLLSLVPLLTTPGRVVAVQRASTT